MNSTPTAAALLSTLVVMVLLGRSLRRHLPPEHLSPDSKDSVKMAMGLVATMTALLLGLLVSSARGTYDTKRNEVIQMAAKVGLLDRVLAAYGPEAAEARVHFRETVAEAVRRMWPDQPGARPQLVPNAREGNAVYSAIQALSPRDDMQRGLKTQATTLTGEIEQLRNLLVAQMVPSIPGSMLLAVACWLAVLFFCFGVLSPPNATTAVALIAAAASVAVAVFLVLELDQPLGGRIRISNEPMLNALNFLGR